MRRQVGWHRGCAGMHLRPWIGTGVFCVPGSAAVMVQGGVRMSIAEVNHIRQTTRLQPSLEELSAQVARLAPGIKTWPVYRELIADLETPVSAYLKISRGATRPGFLLESIEGGRSIG